MAKKNEILLSISLDGDSEVKRKLVDVGEAGKRSLSDIDKRLGNAKNAFSGIQSAAGELKEALAPLTAASGASGLLGGGILGGLLGRLNSPGGFLAGLGAAVSAALVGMARLGEETQRTKGRLAALGDEKGFERTSERAKKLGVDAANLRPGLEQFRTFSQRVNAENETVIHPAGFKPAAAEEAAGGVRIIGRGGQDLTPPSTPAFEKFNDALFKQVRRDVKTDDEAKAITDAFNKSVQTQGLTPDALHLLPPNAGSFLAAQMSKALSRNFANPEELAVALERQRIPAQNFSSVVNAGAVPAPEFDKAAQGARGITQGAGAVSAAIGRRLEETGGDHAGLGAALDSAAKFIDSRGGYRPPKTLTEIGQSAGSFVNGLRQDYPLPQRPAPGILAPSLDPSKLPLGFQTFDAVTRSGGEAAPNAAGNAAEIDAASKQTIEALQTLAPAITEAATAIRNGVQPGSASAGPSSTEPQKFAGGGGIDITGGGAISGPGTGTSDSVPVANVSNGEYVVKERSAGKLGLQVLDYLNEHGRLPGYADGGQIVGNLLGRMLGLGEHSVTPTDDGGAIVDGQYYPANSPMLQDPAIKRALASARAAGGTSSRKHKSDFVGLFGGHAFDTPGSYAKGGAIGHIMSRSISVPGFADGGAVSDAIGWSGSAPSLSDLAPAGGLGDLTDFGHVKLSDGRSTFSVISHRDVAEALRREARDRADVSMGSQSWKYGR